MNPDDHEALVVALRQTRKYRHLCDEVLDWAAADALARHQRPKDALKAAKRKLHQAFGSFVESRRMLLGALHRAASDADEQAWRQSLREALRHHTSTSERGAAPEAFWDAIRAHTGHFDRILDLGCGVMPATLPWSGCDTSVNYWGFDLDEELTQALANALSGRFPHLELATSDVRQPQSWPDVDLVLLAKLLPTLERQAAGAATTLVRDLPMNTWVVATFPTQSLTGQARGMASRYRALAEQWLGPGTVMDLGSELLYITRRAC